MPSLAAAAAVGPSQIGVEDVAGCGTTRIVGATAWIRGGTHVRGAKRGPAMPARAFSFARLMVALAQGFRSGLVKSATRTVGLRCTQGREGSSATPRRGFWNFSVGLRFRAKEPERVAHLGFIHSLPET
jgi:hypothetical protein